MVGVEVHRRLVSLGEIYSEIVNNMYISRIYIKNYRNFKNFDLFIHNGEPLTVIGGNNSGKTNLLQAIRLVLDSQMKPWEKQMSESDFRGAWVMSLGSMEKKSYYYVVSN